MIIKNKHSKKELLNKIKSLENEIRTIKPDKIDIRTKDNTLINLALYLKNEGIDIILIDKEINEITNTNPSLSLNVLWSLPQNIEELKSILAPEDQEHFFQVYNKLNINSSIKFQSKLILLKSDVKETKPVEFILINDESNKVTIAIKDITEITKQKRELIKVKEKIEESDKLKTTLLSNISHQIRTPLNSITGFSELLAAGEADKGKRKEYIHIIKRQSKRILNLIDDISEISKLESGAINITKIPCNLKLLLNELLLGFNQQRTTTRKELVEIELILPEAKHSDILSDSGRLQQVLLNIINNSLRYTQQGKIQYGYTIDEHLRKIEFFIKDTSDGLSKEDQKVLFNRFMTIDNSENSKLEDPGLSLTIAREIVKALGGKIWVESEKGKGTSYFFNIPYDEVTNTEPEENSYDAIPEESYYWPNKVILIVDDEDVNAMFLEAVFQITNVQLLVAKNGLQALELVKNINKIDLILMDLKMPVMNGIKATREIRKINKNIPIIAQTALASEEDRMDSEAAGCNSTITKPIEIEELLQLVNSYIAD